MSFVGFHVIGNSQQVEDPHLSSDRFSLLPQRSSILKRSGLLPVAEKCVDVQPLFCSLHANIICSNAAYTSWASAHCQKTCKICSDKDCVIKKTGKVYAHGATWQDGCDKNCTCINGIYSCIELCPFYEDLPRNWSLVKNQDECCSHPVYTPESTCVYKGKSYKQGQHWEDGCDNTCECINATIGRLKCHNRCPRYGSLPPNCRLVPDAQDRCCQKPECSPSTGQSTCVDKLSTCSQYGQNACAKPYDGWAKDNCAKYCGFCETSGPVTTPASTGPCVDKIPNCKDYTTSVCSGHYQSWANYNCPVFCNMCGTGTMTGTGGTETMTGTGGTGTMTGTGGTGTMTAGTCSDALPNCAEYTRTSCQEPYLNWAKQNCAKFCGFCGHSDGSKGLYTCRALCGTYTNLPQGCTLQKAQGECCAKPVCQGGTGTGTGIGTSGTGTISGQGTGCLFQKTNQLYQQGQTWDDGCTYKCTCTDASKGFYTCQEKCMKWNLPSVCKLNPPAPGKCCQTPNCPSYVLINYPPGYKEE